MDLLDLDAVDALLEALGEPTPLQQAEHPPAWDWNDLDELMSGYTTQDDRDDILLLDLEAKDVDVDPTQAVDVDDKKRVNPRRKKRKVTEALRFEKHGVEVVPVGKRRFLYHFKQGTETVTALQAAMRMCTAEEATQAAATAPKMTPEPKDTPELEAPCDYSDHVGRF